MRRKPVSREVLYGLAHDLCTGPVQTTKLELAAIFGCTIEDLWMVAYWQTTTAGPFMCTLSMEIAPWSTIHEEATADPDRVVALIERLEWQLAPTMPSREINRKLLKAALAAFKRAQVSAAVAKL